MTSVAGIPSLSILYIEHTSCATGVNDSQFKSVFLDEILRKRQVRKNMWSKKVTIGQREEKQISISNRRRNKRKRKIWNRR